MTTVVSTLMNIAEEYGERVTDVTESPVSVLWVPPLNVWVRDVSDLF